MQRADYIIFISFYIRDLRFLVCSGQEAWNQSPVDTKRWLTFGGVKVTHIFLSMGGSVPLTPVLFKSGLYLYI